MLGFCGPSCRRLLCAHARCASAGLGGRWMWGLAFLCLFHGTVRNVDVCVAGARAAHTIRLKRKVGAQSIRSAKSCACHVQGLVGGKTRGRVSTLV